MFTGLIEGLGQVTHCTKPTPHALTRLQVQPPATADWCLGESVAVNGCCLTVAHLPEGGGLCFDVSAETLSCTNLGELTRGSLVNLERAMTLSQRLGGHLVSGHVDTTTRVLGLSPCASGWLLTIALASHFARYVIAKGSLCLNGVSLTINRISPRPPAQADAEAELQLDFTLIPTTLELTNLRQLKADDRLNVEFDLIGKYVENMLTPYQRPEPSR